MISYTPERLDAETQQHRARAFFEEMDKRRSVRFFADDSVPLGLIEEAIRTASTAPSGAHKQLFIAALHHAGLATLTHTPFPMKFLTKLLGRPESERPFCLFPIGYPAPDCVVPDLHRKRLDEVMVKVGA